MKSPFPGMDPYLETHWRDVHHSFLNYARDALQEHLPNDLRAKLEERVFVEPDFDDARSIYSDLRVIEYPRGRSNSENETKSGVTVADPIVIHAPAERATEGYIKIVDVGSGNRVVSVIELLSESNKYPGDGQAQYLRKQREYLQGGISLVEIDLLRGGKRVLAVPARWVPPLAPHHLPDLRGAGLEACLVRSVWRPAARTVARHPRAVARARRGCAAGLADADRWLLSSRPLRRHRLPRRPHPTPESG